MCATQVSVLRRCLGMQLLLWTNFAHLYPLSVNTRSPRLVCHVCHPWYLGMPNLVLVLKSVSTCPAGRALERLRPEFRSAIISVSIES
ncbi:uncharacterized protein LY79DRAFT_554125 [Colletotrichum navitas]|uniref:Secreted protein n=1 Tax=Colletotrichum navitas TaxID=681940 RepID=A0AAD8V4S4_9PEZI|nr:uncharacterized protein LY79DRAFT_554125 [Colletotrichum navitas]KAK1590536.1 hypothetical protein LY79DRAFT_554125 [Colletotrichum navitas]